jgi:hypothetical protein
MNLETVLASSAALQIERPRPNVWVQPLRELGDEDSFE